MKIILPLVTIFYLLIFTQSQDIIYAVDTVFEYLDGEGLEDNEYQEILGNLSKIFADSYAFNDIAKKPPQPSFDKNYFTAVDIQDKLKKIETKDINMYEFYQKLTNALGDLKDSHIQMYFEDNSFGDFYILSPFQYVIGEYKGKPRMFATCINQNYLKYFDSYNEIYEFCVQYYNLPIKSINGKDPFEYISNFGGKLAATKNIHGTFTFKMNFNNDVSLRDYPLTAEELNQLVCVFEGDADTITIKTSYRLHSEINIEQENNLRALGTGRRVRRKYKNQLNERKKEKMDKRKSRKNKLFTENKLRNLATEIIWNYDVEDIFKCYVDETNKINVYYVNSFEPTDRTKFKNAIKSCVELFDKNTNPILVVNELNNGGYISLAQLFMGVLSPLMPINLFKGRLRMTDGITESNELEQYLNSNLTSINTCKKQTFQDLLKEKVTPNYSTNQLSQMFFINNASIHDEIENMRQSMKNKRKPTEILVLTDGYSFSAAGLYIKYLQKMGGAIVVGYFGNPYNNAEFDSGQSPSPIFTSSLLNIFNKNENTFLVKEYNILLEFPGIQTFYGLDDKDVPLEYEVTPVDQRIKIYSEFDENSYQTFMDESNSLFKNITNKCYPSNKNLIKISKDCDSSFKNNYTHGGYLCKDDGTWSNECIAAYCELGYSFDKNKRKCIKDVCSSIPIPEIIDDEEEQKSGNEDGGSSNIVLIVVIVIVILLIIFIVVFLVLHCKKEKLRSDSIEYNKEATDMGI